jgi:urease accessory protein UreE
LTEQLFVDEDKEKIVFHLKDVKVEQERKRKTTNSKTEYFKTLKEEEGKTIRDGPRLGGKNKKVR